MRKWRRNTPQQKRILKAHKLSPWLWRIIGAYGDGTQMALNWLTGEVRCFQK